MNYRINLTLACAIGLSSLCAQQQSFATAGYIPAKKAVTKVSTSADLNSVNIQIALNKSRLITLDRNVAEISQGNPAIADFPEDKSAEEQGSAETTFIPPNQILIRGKALGTTNLILWDDKGKVIKILDIEVTHDLVSLRAKLHEILPKENINVRSVQKNIVLSGEANTPISMQAALDLAKGYLGTSTTLGSGNTGGGSGTTGGGGAGGNINVNNNASRPVVDPSKGAVPSVINLMKVGGAQQVMLDVKVAEISREVIKGLNIQFNNMQNSKTFAIGSVTGALSSMSPSIANTTVQPTVISGMAMFLSAISGQFIFDLTIQAANEQHLAKILAQPTLTTLSGQEANFFAGGEFPVPVPQGGYNSGTVTVIYKKFGIELRFLPLVLDSGRINLSMNVGVSDISPNNFISAAVGTTTSSFLIPALDKREASSTLEMADGQTMSIAGLISDYVTENINKFPGLGDIPILGAMFRSSAFDKKKTELVIFVTPHLAKPILANKAFLPTETFVEPDDVDFYILGRTESRKVRNRWVDDKGGLDGSYGQQLLEGGR